MTSRISMITPSYERQGFLKSQYQGLLQQDYAGEWEWLILDMSTYPSSFFCDLEDERVRYWHIEERVSIGKARNILKDRASGEIIVHFDDDDYYGPSYLSTVHANLQKHAFFKLYSWFNYDVKTNQFYYWATDEAADTHFVLDPFTGTRTREVDFGPLLKEKQNQFLQENGYSGYGFSYAYRKEVAQACDFPDLDFKEDMEFYELVQEKKFPMKIIPDRQGLIIKIIHDNNVSHVYPQYRIPPFIAERFFPKFSEYLSHYPHSQLSLE